MFLTSAELAATKDKIAKIEKRKRERGFTGSLKVEWEPAERKYYSAAGLDVTQDGYEVTITGEPPKYEGWTFLALAEWDGNTSEPVIRTAPGVESVDRAGLEEGKCDHCQTDRRRRKAYIVRHDDGRQLQVGSACIKDFIGWDAMPVFISDDDVSEYKLFGDGGCGARDASYDTETVLAAAWAVIQRYGYVRSNDYASGTPTKDAVLDVLQPRGNAARELAREIEPFIPDAIPMARTIRAFVLSPGYSGPGEYVRNLKIIAAGDFVSPRNFGFIVSAPQAYAREQEKTLIRERERAEILNEWNGHKDERLTLEVSVVGEKYLPPGNYGTRILYTFKDGEKRVYKTFRNGEPFWAKLPEGTVRIKGTVARLEEWKGQKSTMLSRVAVL